MLTQKQENIKNRRDVVRLRFESRGETPTSALVNALSIKLKVSQVTIYSDLKHLGFTGKKDEQAV